ncbi:hypothetical protein [Algicella marina]|nr:hypothetical protein [Algicella marina]
MRDQSKRIPENRVAGQASMADVTVHIDYRRGRSRYGDIAFGW